VSPGDEVTSVDFGDRAAGDFPLERWRKLRLGLDRLHELASVRQLAEARAMPVTSDRAIRDLYGTSIYLPLGSGKIHQRLTGGGRGFA